MLTKLAHVIVEIFFHRVLNEWSENIEKIAAVSGKSTLVNMVYKIDTAFNTQSIELDSAKQYITSLEEAIKRYQTAERKLDNAHAVGTVLLEDMPKVELANYIIESPYIHKVNAIKAIRRIYDMGLMEAKKYYENHINN